MTAKKKLTLIIMTVILLLALIITAVLLWFFSPGIHRLFSFTHIECDTDGYLVSMDGEVIGKATLSLNGTAKPGPVSNRDKAYFFNAELTGLEPVSKDDYAPGCTSKIKNGICELYISKNILPEDLDLAKLKTVKYHILLDDKKSELLMCTYLFSNSDNTKQEYFFIPTNNPDTAYEEIKQIWLKAYG